MKVLLVEILTVIEQPLSANHVHNISEKKIPLSLAYYHLTSLEKLGVLEKVDSRRARGATERLFFWAEGMR